MKQLAVYRRSTGTEASGIVNSNSAVSIVVMSLVK